MLFFPDTPVEVAIVGGGPAGLTAAIYLARFLRSVAVFDAGDARAKLIPRTHNCPGFPEGISGEDLLRRLTEQAVSYGTTIIEGGVESIDKKGGLFVLETTAGRVIAERVILATGIVDKAPEIPDLHQAITCGSVRLCPICDAYEVIGKRIGVVGPERLALKEALFLRDFSQDVSILANYPEDLSAPTRRAAAAAGIQICDRVDDLLPNGAGFQIVTADRSPGPEIDVIYPSLGCDVRSELAAPLGVQCDEEGYILVSGHLETSVTGLYAIGDVAKALNQIAVGFGHAAIAASHIHNDLRGQS